MTHFSTKQLQLLAQKLLKEIEARQTLNPKDRLAIPVQDMPSQNPQTRIKNMEEVTLGYTEEQAIVEANRCLGCKTAPCVKGCPVGINIPAFINAITKHDFKKAINIIKESSLLPAVCGRVCPQEEQCQLPCTVGKSLKDINKAVSIGRLERFLADWKRQQNISDKPTKKPDTEKKVAIIGCGPAGITVAADLRREGHQVTIFEAFHKSGGVMVYGIPEFRLPKKIVQNEIDSLKKMEVEIKNNFVIGRTRKLFDLMEKDGFDAIFIGTGAGLPKFMNIPGENYVGVFSANEYLTRVNLMKAYETEKFETPLFAGERVAVLGGGNVAMDAARTAIRIGAKEVHLIYRRTEVEMPARKEEVAHAKEEGVQFHLLQNAKRIISNDTGYVSGIECIKYTLGEPDKSGRRRPIEIPNSEFMIAVDTVIVAIGNGSNPLIKQTTPNLTVTNSGNIIIDDQCRTSIQGIWAGGDIVLGAATVILAMGQGRIAAQSINEYLNNGL